MTWTLPWLEPSLISRKLKPPLESRRVRTQPCSLTCLPTASSRRAAATLILSIGSSWGRWVVSVLAAIIQDSGRTVEDGFCSPRPFVGEGSGERGLDLSVRERGASANR